MNLVVMAAGMGSRFGGLKQLTPVGPSGEFLIDYSVYDARKCGVEKVIFVIRKEHENLFKDTIGKRIEKMIKVEYVYQELDDLPITPKETINRQKPWGTGQALFAVRDAVDSSFMIINADDFYGRDAFQTLSKYLKEPPTSTKKQYAMVGYLLKNTLSDNGTVSRGICEVENDYLKQIVERTKVQYLNNNCVYFEGEQAIPLDENSKVSVNLFGFTKEIFEDAKNYFIEFLTQEKELNTKEFYLPTIVRKSIEEEKAEVKVLPTTSKFFGMTYQEDLEGLKENIRKLVQEGVYPENLWEEQS